jgi:signal transduction histidine kinase
MSAISIDPRRLERLLEVGRGLVSHRDSEIVLREVVEAARDLTAARYAALGVLDETGTELGRFLTSGIDEETRERIGPLPHGHGILGELIRDPRPLRLDSIGAHPRSYGFPEGHPRMSTFLGVPVKIRGEVFGNLYLTEKAGGVPFDGEDEQVLVVLAEWAAIAIDNASSIEAEKMRLSIASSERERKRWAREIHDETLQELGALNVILESALEIDDPVAMRRALESSSEQLERVITGLQGMVTELRPAALDQLGVEPAIEALVERLGQRSGLAIELDVDLVDDGRLSPEVESTIYRAVQEALNNVIKHAHADRARVLVEGRRDEIAIRVEDDGAGFAAGGGGQGFGLVGMRERIALVGGTLAITAAAGGGTRVSASLPVTRAVRSHVEDVDAVIGPGREPT